MTTGQGRTAVTVAPRTDRPVRPEQILCHYDAEKHIVTFELVRRRQNA